MATIDRFRIANFKSYGDTPGAVLPLAPLTLLIGANASGKSNALEAIQFLSWLARGRRLDDIWDSVAGEELALRGTMPDLFHTASKSFQIGCILDGVPWGWDTLCISIQGFPGGLRIADERVSRSGEDLYWTEGSGPNVLRVFYRYPELGQFPVTVSDQHAIFTQAGWASVALPATTLTSQQQEEDSAEAAEHFRRALTKVLFLNPVPARMRGYGSSADRRLKSHGDNLSAVLWNICQKPEQKEQVLAFVRAFPEQDIRDIDFLETPRKDVKDVMVRLTESFGQKTVQREAPLLSDGTLRVLAIAAALLSVPEESLVAIEEVDNGIHPSRAQMVLASMEKVARERRLRVLLTTHNPALADALPLDAVPHVVYCYRDPKEGDSRLVRLSDLPEYPELVAQGPLGQLMTQGTIERFAKDPRTPEEKRKAAMSWMDTFLREGEEA